jgi:hypothetical protein
VRHAQAITDAARAARIMRTPRPGHCERRAASAVRPGTAAIPLPWPRDEPRVTAWSVGDRRTTPMHCTAGRPGRRRYSVAVCSRLPALLGRVWVACACTRPPVQNQCATTGRASPIEPVKGAALAADRAFRVVGLPRSGLRRDGKLGGAVSCPAISSTSGGRSSAYWR